MSSFERASEALRHAAEDKSVPLDERMSNLGTLRDYMDDLESDLDDALASEEAEEEDDEG